MEYHPQHRVQRISMSCLHGIAWTACQRGEGCFPVDTVGRASEGVLQDKH
jgi:hypothetical protein